jgi:hypothetical protein
VIRLFVHASETGTTSDLGLAYTDALVAAKIRVRIIAVELAELWEEIPARHDRRTGAVVTPAKPAARWSRHRSLFAVPVVSPYINAVCATANHWGRLYTVGVRNVLLTDQGPTAHGKHYQQVIVPTEEIAAGWSPTLAAHQIAVVPVALGPQLAILTHALFGPE